MTNESTLEQLAEVQDPLRLYQDLIIALLWLGMTVLCITLPPLNGTVVRVLFALPTILFLPGYVLIAALFPASDDLDMLERVALSFGLSIAVVPLIGLALNYTPFGIRLEPVVTALVLFTVVLTIAAAIRRVTIEPERRFQLPLGEIARDLRTMMVPEGSSRLDRALSLLLIIAIVAAVTTTIYVIVVPKEGEKFTEFYVLGEKGKAADYPRTLITGDEYGVIIGVGNHEYRNITYLIEAHAMNMTFDPLTNTSSVNAMEQLDRFTLTIPHNTTVERRWNFTAPDAIYNRIQFLLFNETVPEEDSGGQERMNASYRDLHLWVETRSR